jgi:hypothetical protein
LAGLVADFIGKTEANRPFPLLGDGDTGTNMVADPVYALATALVGEDVEADFELVGETVGDLDGFVLGVVDWIKPVGHGLSAINGEITVELNHGVAGINQIGAVDLNFVIVLRASRHSRREKQTTR